MIEALGLHKSFKDKQALKGISFRVEQGEVFGFLGPNGAGKTTTIKILTGQIRPGSGAAVVLGRDVSTGVRPIIGRIGVVPENTNLYERLTIRQNLEFFCRLFEAPLSAIDPLLAEAGLVGDADRPVRRLSKGTKQRALVIRALLHGPRVLFLDEPTAGLDPVSAHGIHQILRRLSSEGVTIFLTSHNMEEVDLLCNRVVFLDCGLIVEQGSPAELKLKYGGNRMEAVAQGSAGLEKITLGMSGAESARKLEELVSGGRLKAIHSCEPTLADIFRNVTGRELS